ncbi:MAG: hypothetical protein VX246_15705 [Myxococcota bacterium]|nr:hypothetical protein [Myxococcota bacterium]
MIRCLVVPRSASLGAAFITAIATSLACATELPRSTPKPPSTESIVEIVIADPVGAITASIEEVDTIERVLGSWALSSSHWRTPWVPNEPLYWIELYGERAANVPPRIYGLGRSGSRWWISSSNQPTASMKSLPAADERELLFDLEIPGYMQ